MMSGKTSKKSSTNNLVRTDKIVGHLKKLSDGWGGALTKKPAVKAVNRLKKILGRLEDGHMPFPVVTAVANGGIVLTWVSITRDIFLTIDPDGDVQYVTSLKRIDRDSGEILERMDSEGAVTDLLTIDHMMAWYCSDRSYLA